MHNSQCLSIVFILNREKRSQRFIFIFRVLWKPPPYRAGPGKTSSGHVLLAPVELLLVRLLRYVRVPKVHQKDQPGPVPVVHHLVLEAVVDDRPLARLPSHSLVAHPDTHLPLLGHDQTKVSTEPRVGRSRVRGDRCVG